MLLLILLTVFGLGYGLDQVPSKVEIESSINRTIEEVERMIEKDQKLPKLSREQIVDILFNITSQDIDSMEESVRQARSDYQRALMVVLPYNSKDAKDQDIKDLYTKPPMVQVIPDAEGMLPFSSIQEESPVLDNFINAKYVEEINNEFGSMEHPERFSLINDDWEVEVKKKELIEKNTEAVTDPTTKSTANVLTSDQWKYFESPVTPKISTSTTTKRPKTSTTTTKRPKTSTTTTKRPKTTTTTTRRPTTTSTTKRPTTSSTTTTRPTTRSSIIKKLPSWAPFLPTAMSSTEDAQSVPSIPPFKKLPTTLTPEIITVTKQKEPSVFVTPMSEDSQPDIPMKKEVMSLLKSIGLGIKLNHSEGIFQVPESQSQSQTVDAPTIAQQNTFEETPKDVKQGFNNLTPDVQWMFQKFGLADLQESKKPTTTTIKPFVPIWNNFKPLPTSQVKDESMRDFLAKFGLFDNRNRKSMNLKATTQKTTSVIEAVPENMRDVLANIGLIERKQAKITPRVDSEAKLHVFKPHEIQLSDQRQRIKINQLLDTVRLAQEGQAEVSDVRQAASELLETTKKLKEGPNPLNLEEVMQLYNNEVRNEVKRQNNSSMSDGATDFKEDSNSTTSTTAATTTTTGGIPEEELPVDSEGTSSDSDTKTNIDDLADSFGGTTSEPDPVLPTPRKTGLYFLVDWNSFLEVGEEDKPDKVNLRFAPKVGDRTQFIPVVIP